MGMEAGKAGDGADDVAPTPDKGLAPLPTSTDEPRPWAAVVQIVTILVMGAVLVADLLLEGDPVPTLVYGMLAGIALGIEPNTIKGFFRG